MIVMSECPFRMLSFGYVKQFANLRMAIEIVSFPSNSMVIAW